MSRIFRCNIFEVDNFKSCPLKCANILILGHKSRASHLVSQKGLFMLRKFSFCIKISNISTTPGLQQRGEFFHRAFFLWNVKQTKNRDEGICWLLRFESHDIGYFVVYVFLQSASICHPLSYSCNVRLPLNRGNMILAGAKN